MQEGARARHRARRGRGGGAPLTDGRLDGLKRRNGVCVAQREPHAEAAQVVALGKGEELRAHSTARKQAEAQVLPQAQAQAPATDCSEW